MPSLKEVRIRINSVRSTQQITSAMKLVAASKLRRAQTAILQMRPYAAKLKELLQNLSSTLEPGDETSVYSVPREPGTVLLVLVSSNRGLCGGFNANIIRAANQRIYTHYSSQQAAGKLFLLTIGKKVTDFFTRRKFNVVASHDHIFNQLTFARVTPLAKQLMEEYASGRYDRIEIIYNHFLNAASQSVRVEQFLPVPAPSGQEPRERIMPTDYIFEPDKKEFVRDLIPKSLKIQFYKVFIDSFAAEHGARMTAMHQATDNARELLKDLRLAYNKARQATITKELLEIVSGAEALKG
ncbi:MAG: ATP synthase F1 subunit gamma [Bacteroidales bacterium]|nr:ATP synthase F1 subunit gamma [Bacteroidales bacterium]